MIATLSVRLGDAVVQGRSSHPVTVEGEVTRFYVAFMPGNPTLRYDRVFVAELQRIWREARIRLGIDDVGGRTKMAYELPPISLHSPMQHDAALLEISRQLRRGDSLTFAVELGGSPPAVPILMHAIFEIEEAATQPTLH